MYFNFEDEQSKGLALSNFSKTSQQVMSGRELWSSTFSTVNLEFTST